jgi:hypothetical protein
MRTSVGARPAARDAGAAQKLYCFAVRERGFVGKPRNTHLFNGT